MSSSTPVSLTLTLTLTLNLALTLLLTLTLTLTLILTLTLTLTPTLTRYNMLSFSILQRTSPITHVILHAVRRILVIAISTAMLRNQITALNWLGIGVAFVGVLGYSLSP